MRRVIQYLVLIFTLCLVWAWASAALADQLEDKLFDAAINGQANAVRTLIDKGANINVKDNDGWTALMQAAYYGYADVAQVLIEKGADVTARDKSGETALNKAEARRKTEIANMLRAAMSSSIARMADPRETLNQYISELQKKSYDRNLRKQIILFAYSMTPPPAIPEEAQRAFIQGNVFMKAAKNADDYKLAIDKYQEALNNAPWWGEAYYNLAMAENSAGNVDAAQANLELYIFTKPKDAAQAQSKIYEIEAQQELQRKREDAMRAKYGYSQGGSFGWDDLFRYGAVVQKMSFDASGNERTISLKIVTRKESGFLRTYFQIADITSSNDTFLQKFSIDWRGTNTFYLDDRTYPNKYLMTLTVTSYGDGDANITIRPANNASASIKTSLNALLKELVSQAVYAGGTINIGGRDFYTLGQGGAKGSLLFFPAEIKNQLEHGTTNDLMPKLVAIVSYRGSDGSNQRYNNSDLGEVNGTHYHLEFNGSYYEAKIGRGEDH